MVNLESETIVVAVLATLIIGYLVWTNIKMKFAHRNAIKEASKRLKDIFIATDICFK